jgi:hypothetical protein
MAGTAAIMAGMAAIMVDIMVAITKFG